MSNQKDEKDRNAIVEFLSQSENAALALEIEEYMAKVKDQLQKRFWADYFRLLRATFPTGEIGTHWQIGELPQKAYDDLDYGIDIVPRVPCASKNVLTFRVEQWWNRSKFTLSAGVLCGSAKLLKRKDVIELHRKAKEGGENKSFVKDYWEDSAVLRHLLPSGLKEPRSKFLRSYVEEKEPFVQELVNGTLDFVKKWSQDVLKINDALAGKG